MFIVDVAVVLLVWVSLMVSVVLIRRVAVGWQEWVSLVVRSVLVEVRLGVVVVE
jgi:hypothetical protein